MSKHSLAGLNIGRKRKTASTRDWRGGIVNEMSVRYYVYGTLVCLFRYSYSPPPFVFHEVARAVTFCTVL